MTTPTDITEELDTAEELVMALAQAAPRDMLMEMVKGFMHQSREMAEVIDNAVTLIHENATFIQSGDAPHFTRLFEEVAEILLDDGYESAVENGLWEADES